MDEIGCSFFSPFLYILVATAIAQAALIMVYELYSSGCWNLKILNEWDSDSMKESQLFLNTLYYVKQTGRVDDTLQLIQEHYNSLKGEKSEVFDHIFDQYGNSPETRDFLDAIDSSPFHKLKVSLQSRTPLWMLLLAGSPGARILRHYLSLLLVTTLYYSDVAKDVLITIQFTSKVLSQSAFTYEDFANNTYPVVIFCLLAASIALTEVLNALTILMFTPRTCGPVSRRLRCLMALATPLLPGVTLFAEKKLELRMLSSCGSQVPSEDTHKQWMQCKMLKFTVQRLRMALRANENFVEHFVQLTVFVTVLLAEESETRPVQSVGNIIVESSRSFVLFTVVTSMLSLVHGHVDYINMHKNGNLPFVGKAILGVYFALSVLGRVFALVIFFTPILGLFNILRMAEIGMLPASNDTVFDINASGEVKTMEEFWLLRFKLSAVSDLFSGRPAWLTYLVIISSTLLFHLTLALVILSKALKLRSFEMWCSLLHTCVCPPLFLDWEHIYRAGPGQITVKRCWDTSESLHRSFVALFALENLILCIPLTVLKCNFDARAAALESELFPLLSQEKESLAIANSLILTSAIGFALVLPCLQLLFARLYFRYSYMVLKLIYPL